MKITEESARTAEQNGFDELDDDQPQRHDYNPERRLWVAVLLQAVLDFQSNNARAQREAEKFLLQSPADLEAVCHRAGLNPSVFQSKLSRLSRAKPIAGIARMVLAA